MGMRGSEGQMSGEGRVRVAKKAGMKKMWRKGVRQGRGEGVRGTGCRDVSREW